MTKPLYFWNGTTFEQIGPTVPQSPIAYQTSAPTGPATGDLWIDSDGDVDTYNRQLTRFYFVATAGQTSVSGTDANGLTLAYVAGSEAVYVNGALQVRGVDYTATNGTSITGLTALALNDVVEVFAYTAFTVANAYTKSETDSIAAAAAGLRMVVPTSVAVGSGSGSVDTIGNVTFSGASSVSLNECFNATYDNYAILINLSTAPADDISIRMRVSGSDNSSSNYRNGLFYVGAYNSQANGAVNNSTSTSFGGIVYGDTTIASSSQINIYNPFNTAYTKSTWIGAGSNFVTGGGVMTVNTSYTGFTLRALGGGNLSGTLRVYGYKD
jgi:hypothetical protein